MSKHSPLPWSITTYKNAVNEYILDSSGKRLFMMYTENDADFIVEACNNYEALKKENEQLKEALSIALEYIKIDNEEVILKPLKEAIYNFSNQAKQLLKGR